MYGYAGEPQPIYVDTQITRESFLLFKLAKNLKKIGVKFVWLSLDGDILVREKPNAPIISIKNAAQISEIEKKNASQESEHIATQWYGKRTNT